jgi:hypothetical protein
MIVYHFVDRYIDTDTHGILNKKEYYKLGGASCREACVVSDFQLSQVDEPL